MYIIDFSQFTNWFNAKNTFQLADAVDLILSDKNFSVINMNLMMESLSYYLFDYWYLSNYIAFYEIWFVFDKHTHTIFLSVCLFVRCTYVVQGGFSYFFCNLIMTVSVSAISVDAISHLTTYWMFGVYITCKHNFIYCVMISVSLFAALLILGDGIYLE